VLLLNGRQINDSFIMTKNLAKVRLPPLVRSHHCRRCAALLKGEARPFGLAKIRGWV
jgi:hypothetical protein